MSWDYNCGYSGLTKCVKDVTPFGNFVTFHAGRESIFVKCSLSDSFPEHPHEHEHLIPRDYPLFEPGSH